MDLPSVETLEQASAFGANVATVLALAAGGYWTYSRFFKNRTGRPKAAMSFSIEDRRLTSDDLLVRVAVKLENRGNVLLPVECLRCEVAQVDPPSEEALERLTERKLITEERLADLGCIRCYEDEKPTGEIRIEPGESDTFPFDFVVPSNITTISIYSHIGNSSEKKEIGWDLSSFYDLTSSSAQQDQSLLPDTTPQGG